MKKRLSRTYQFNDTKGVKRIMVNVNTRGRLLPMKTIIDYFQQIFEDIGGTTKN